MKLATNEERRAILAAKAEAKAKSLRYRVRSAVQDSERKRKLANLPRLTGEFDVLLIDPPYDHEDAGSSRSAQNHYPVESVDKLKKVRVASISAKDSVIFLWVPGYFLRQGLELLEAYGFRFACQIVWDKEVDETGAWARARHENLLVGVKGNFPAPMSPPASVIVSRRAKHSQKPLLYDLIEGMWNVPGLRYAELYARNAAPRRGWTFFGAEAKPLAVSPVTAITKKDITTRQQAA